MTGEHVTALIEAHGLTDVDRWEDSVVIAKRGRTGVVLLDRPDAGNSHNRAMMHALANAWVHFGEDSEVRVMVMGATTTRNFCTGIDLKEVAEAGGFAGLAALPGYGEVRGSGRTHRDAGVRKPLVCAVEGRAIGGGFTWVAEADIVVASETATFRDTHVERGFVGNRENIFLALKAGLGASLYMSLIGGAVELDAARAERLGLVQEVVEAGAALGRAFELADLIAQNSPTAMARQLEVLWNLTRMHLDEAVDTGENLLAWQQAHADSTEGATAFAAKREPNWLPLK